GDGPLAGMRVARVNGELVVFPTMEQQAASDLDMIVACSKDAIVMVEGGAAEASESDVIDALYFAHKEAQPIIALINKLREAVGKPKRPFEPKKLPADIAAKIPALVDAKILESSLIKDKKKRYDGYKAGKTTKIDALTGERWKRFLLHYNFPPFSTGETKPMRGPGRREIGHGALAERALARMLPEQEKFPYTVRIVSETLESNGSSSMAAVCGG